jgi:hypothetical protein
VNVINVLVECSRCHNHCQFGRLISTVEGFAISVEEKQIRFCKNILISAHCLLTVYLGTYTCVVLKSKQYFANVKSQFIWMVVFLGVILLDVDKGLLIGIAFALYTLILRDQRLDYMSVYWLLFISKVEVVFYFEKA